MIRHLNWKKISSVLALGLLGTTIILAYHLNHLSRYSEIRVDPRKYHTYTSSFYIRNSHDTFGFILGHSDAQAYWANAQDPLLRRTEVFQRHGTKSEAAYRNSRPLFGYIIWAGSLGRPSQVRPALLLTYLISAGLAIAVAGLLLAQRGRSMWWALLLTILPGGLGATNGLGPEFLSLALMLFALLAWQSKRTVLACVLIALAVLARETAIVLPLGLLAANFHLDRRVLRPFAFLASAIIPWASWSVLLRFRTGSFPFGASSGRLGFPFVGLVQAWSHWGLYDAVSFGAIVVLAALTFWKGNTTDRWIMAVIVAFASVLGSEVWGAWDNFSRVLLPCFAFGLIAFVSSLPSRNPLSTV